MSGVFSQPPLSAKSLAIIDKASRSPEDKAQLLKAAQRRSHDPVSLMSFLFNISSLSADPDKFKRYNQPIILDRKRK